MRARGDIENRLSECLERMRAGEPVEPFLEQCGPELGRLLDASSELGSVTIPASSPAAFEGGRARMHRAREAQAVRAIRADRGSMALVASAAVVVAVAFGLSTAGYFPLRASPTEAQVEGILHSVQGSVLVVTTDEGLARIPFDASTQVIDPSGRGSHPSQITPGDPVRIRVARQQSSVARSVLLADGQPPVERPVDVQFEGRVTGVRPHEVIVRTSFGSAVLKLTPQTQLSGELHADEEVRAVATREADGSFVAGQIHGTKPIGGEEKNKEGTAPAAGKDENGAAKGSSAGPRGGVDAKDPKAAKDPKDAGDAKTAERGGQRDHATGPSSSGPNRQGSSAEAERAPTPALIPDGGTTSGSGGGSSGSSESTPTPTSGASVRDSGTGSQSGSGNSGSSEDENAD